MTIYTYGNSDLTLSGTAEDNILIFEDDANCAFDHRHFRFLRQDNDLFIYADNNSVITLTDHFISPTPITTIEFSDTNTTIDMDDINPFIAIGNSKIIGTNNDDLIYGTVYNSTIYGPGGNDTIYGNYDSKIHGGDGDDTIYANAEINNIINAGNGMILYTAMIIEISLTATLAAPSLKLRAEMIQSKLTQVPQSIAVKATTPLMQE